MQQALLPAEPTPKPRPYGYGVIVWTTLSLLPAIFIGRIGWVGMKVTDTALLGHVCIGTSWLVGPHGRASGRRVRLAEPCLCQWGSAIRVGLV